MAITRSARTRNKLQKAHRRTIGFNATRKNLRKFGEQFGAEMNKAAIRTGLRVKENAERVLMTGEGRAPDPRTFELARSVRMVIMTRFVRVGSAVMHGLHQEFGTRRHKASPWLYPAMRREKPYFAAQLNALREKAMRGIDPYEAD